MRSDNKQVLELFKNITEGLKRFTPEEINQALTSFFNSKDDKAAEIDFVLECVCKKFSISRQVLIESTSRGKIQQARQLAYCLLHLNLGLPIRYIAKRIFYKWPNSVSNSIQYYRKCDQKIPSERDFLENYQELQEELVEYIKKQNPNES